MSIRVKLTTLLGDLANEHFYLQVLPQEYKLPCIVFRVVSESPNVGICGPVGGSEYEVVFECYAQEYEDTEALAAEVISRIDADSETISVRSSGPGEDYEPVSDDFMTPVYYTFLTQ